MVCEGFSSRIPNQIFILTIPRAYVILYMLNTYLGTERKHIVQRSLLTTT